MDKAELNRRIEAGAFAAANGRVLRTVNILCGRDISIRSLAYALADLSDGALRDSLFYLQDAGYLRAHDAVTGQSADVTDGGETVAVRLTAAGIRLLKGYLTDPAVRV